VNSRRGSRKRSISRLALVAIVVGAVVAAWMLREPRRVVEKLQPLITLPAAATPTPKPKPVPPAEIWRSFSGEKAFEHVEKLVGYGPRPAGSDASHKTRDAIADALETAGWMVERQQFAVRLGEEELTLTNLVARFGADASTQKIVIGAHYDSKRFSTIEFAGANNGGSGAGALIELARVLALDWDLAAQVELVFFDGCEAVGQFSAQDGLYGSRHYAAQLRNANRISQLDRAIVWDGIGDKQLSLTLPPDSPTPLVRDIREAATALGLTAILAEHPLPIWNDHMPLQQAGIPSLCLTDLDYDAYHTADDTIDKLGPESLQRVGSLTLFFVKKALSK